MTTTTVLSDDAAMIVRDEVSRFSWGPVFAGAAIATAVTFFLVSVGSGLGLALTSVHNATLTGAKTFLTLGAIYFLAAQAFGFAVGGHVTGRLMPPALDDSEEEKFRADAHGLAVWALAVIFGITLVALGTFVAASAAANNATAPAAYWADRLLAPAAQQTAETAGSTPGAAIPDVAGTTTNVANPATGTLADAKAEATRLLAVDGAVPNSDAANTTELTRLVSQYAGLSGTAATARVSQTEQAMHNAAKDAADAARKAASYAGIWTALALLFGAVVCVVATVSARWKDDHNILGRPRPVE